MASIAGTNVVYASYRNAVVGKTSDYAFSTVLTNFKTTLYSMFQDNADDDPLDTDVFHAAISTGALPVIGSKLALASVTVPGDATNPGTGVVDFADPIFTGGAAIAAGDPLESYIVFKFITDTNASPLLVHWGSATGLTGGLTPNGADITVAVNSSGGWKF